MSYTKILSLKNPAILPVSKSDKYPQQKGTAPILQSSMSAMPFILFPLFLFNKTHDPLLPVRQSVRYLPESINNPHSCGRSAPLLPPIRTCSPDLPPARAQTCRLQPAKIVLFDKWRRWCCLENCCWPRGLVSRFLLPAVLRRTGCQLRNR
mgnify:CR=1 FL=1